MPCYTAVELIPQPPAPETPPFLPLLSQPTPSLLDTSPCTSTDITTASPASQTSKKKKNVLWVLFSVFQPGKATESSKTGKRKTGPFYWLLDLSNCTTLLYLSLLYMALWKKNPLPPHFEECEKLTKSSNSFILALSPHHAFSSFLSCSRVCKGPRLLSQQTVLVDIRGGKSTFLTRPAFSSTQKV